MLPRDALVEQLHVALGRVTSEDENGLVLELYALDQLFISIHLHRDGGHRLFRPFKYGKRCIDPTFNFRVIHTRASYLFEDFAQQVLSITADNAPDLPLPRRQRLSFIRIFVAVHKCAILRDRDQSIAQRFAPAEFIPNHLFHYRDSLPFPVNLLTLLFLRIEDRHYLADFLESGGFLDAAEE